MLSTDDFVTEVPLIGPRYSQRLKNLGIETIDDLLHHYPHRYEDFSQTKITTEVRVGERVTIEGTPSDIAIHSTRWNKTYVLAYIHDQRGFLPAVWWNQPWIKQSLTTDHTFYFSGKVDFFNNQPTLINPQFERRKENAVHTSGLVAIYPETEGVTSKWLRSRIATTLKRLKIGENQNCPAGLEYLPEEIQQDYELISLGQALKEIHFPSNKKLLRQARHRLAFDELFQFQSKTYQRRKKWAAQEPAFRLNLPQHLAEIQKIIDELPFELTSAQKSATQEIIEDLEKNKPMNRLLQGDVGSGKTIVAGITSFATSLHNHQTVLMAPTEILAQQHHQTFEDFFGKYLKINLITGSKKPGGQKIRSADVIIGTHALLHVPPETLKPGLVIIDEQHRFGVKQRAKLATYGQKTPHILSLTATPIPRSIALTLYGDQDLSIIDELPPGRKTVKTWLVNDNKRDEALKWVKKKIKEKSYQAFVICPLIERSDHETLENVKAAKDEFARLKKNLQLEDLKIDLIHGQMSDTRKTEAIRLFSQGKVDILVATPVVEVGIDIPKANLMIVEGAERFGLASLHQLRGRIGRRGEQAYCLLFTSPHREAANQRLKALETHHDGLKLAEIDLKIRGPGEIFGTRQHGFWDLKLATLDNTKLIKQVREAVIRIQENSLQS